MKLSDLKVVKNDINFDEYYLEINKVKDGMEHPEWFGIIPIEDLKEIILNGGNVWMFYDNDNFVCSMMSINADSDSNEKLGIKDDPLLGVDYGPQFVSKDYIGNGLQKQMMDYLDMYSIKDNNKYAVATIHPDNSYSINNFIKCGFRCINTLELKRGPRDVYYKEL